MDGLPGRTGVGTVEMTAMMYAAFAVVFPFYWLGVVSANGLMVLGHVLMLLGTAVVMLRRRADHLAAR